MSLLRCWFSLLILVVTAAMPEPPAQAADPSGRFHFVCRADNDLYAALRAGRSDYPRYEDAAAAVKAATLGSAVLILADEYPDKQTAIAPTILADATAKQLHLYVEFPANLPDTPVGAPKEDRLLRGVVVTEVFGAALPPMRIVGLNACRYVSVEAKDAHLVLARVAGVDTAVFGLENTPTIPLLFDHPRGNLLVATTKLSHFVTGRYMPDAAWHTIWQTILHRLQPDAPPAVLKWTPTVRPSYGRDEALPANAELQALHRSADWIIHSRVLRHPRWPQEALDWALHYNTVREKPADDWPAGDGSLGTLEGYSSTIRADGSQPMRYAVRNDNMCEVAMLMALDAATRPRPENREIAARLLDYVFLTSGLAGGERKNPVSPEYGLIGWSHDLPGHYWSDDGARGILSLLAVSALLKERAPSSQPAGVSFSLGDALARDVLANFRTTGLYGFREDCVLAADLQKHGWQHYWNARTIRYSPHYVGWIWAGYLWAYEQTRFEPFMARTENALRMLMQAYPDRWYWTNRSGAIERARALLPLAWLVRVSDTPEHREWLRRVARDLIALQDRSGAIREIIGDGSHGTLTNAEYGTCETSLIQTNGDPIADLLYTCNFAFIGLHEAAAATGEPMYVEAEDRLAKFLCRIQIRSAAHPELDGAWYRGFDFGKWEYWASNADWEWGPWCTETGWTQPWIAGTMALRHLKTSLWDLAGQADLGGDFDALRRQMLPDDVLSALPPGCIRHAAIGRPITLAASPDARYPGNGTSGLVDGILGFDQCQAAEWMGFHSADFSATVDLGEPTTIVSLGAGFLQHAAMGIYLPARVEFSVSHDGQTFRPLETVTPTIKPQEPGPLRQTLTTRALDIRARYVRVTAVNLGEIPAGQPAAGAKAWLFVDEIVVNPSR